MVLSDSVVGLEELFGDAVEVYASRDELHGAIDRLLADDKMRRERAERGRQIVLAPHTFSHRVATLLEHVDARRAELGLDSSIGGDRVHDSPREAPRSIGRASESM